MVLVGEVEVKAQVQVLVQVQERRGKQEFGRAVVALDGRGNRKRRTGADRCRQ
jgi:hypothetical protein